ncbi:hypothetical protein JD79_00528 [Geodermatophilus normandii]|uniref:O-antigen ligase family protein n=1 Tax=Geodermatophilus normandii TaxID=1137989 RepID=A0A317QEH2_9ACTN|nr:hypothetical protein [Geodermatophilus normandii]PWW21399.1 hypothetical protein JD79_00528 [Geodermatophilus normandii]
MESGDGDERRAGADGDVRSGPLLTRPGTVLLAVVAAWTAVPSVVAPPKLTWGLLALLLGAVAVVLLRHARGMRWTTPVTLLTVVLLCATVSAVRSAAVDELVTATLTAALLVGCALLAVNCGPGDVRLLTRGLVLLALAELAVALASALLGVPAPWGYLGIAGTTFEVNDLVPALGGRSTGSMAHPIPFGTLMALAAALCLTSVTRWPLLVRTVAGAAACYGLALSGSRSAALVLCTAAVVTVLTPRALRIGAAARVGVVLVLAAAVLALQDARLSAVTSLQGTGSLTHRLGALDALTRLLGRPPAETLLGSGTGSLDDLFAAGLLQRDGFLTVDNQLVTTFALSGLVGLAALLGMVAVGLLRGVPGVRPAALLLVGMVMSFDLLEWTATAVLFVVLVLLGSARRPAAAPLLDDALPAPAAAVRP